MKYMTPSRAEQLLLMCYQRAALSPDPSNQNGALVYIPETGIIVSDECNRFPRCVEVTEELLANRDQKLKYIEHAERCAVYASAASNYSTEGQAMFCPWAACHECARSIILSGIKHLVVHQARMDTTPERWLEDVNGALQLMKDSGIIIYYFDKPVRGAPNIRVNGQDWSPEYGFVQP